MEIEDGLGWTARECGSAKDSGIRVRAGECLGLALLWGLSALTLR